MTLPAAPITDRRYTVEEYFDLVDRVEGKYEYHDGKLVNWRAMAGAAEPHSLIAANIIGELRSALRGKPCRVYTSDLIVRIGKKTKYRFPDATVICGPTIFDPNDPSRAKAVLNPKLIVEVLSPTSEGMDRGDKFTEYREIESLEEYVLVSQDKPMIESFRRQSDGTWLFSPTSGMEAVAELKSIGASLSLKEVFAGVEFPPEPPPERHPFADLP
jgi:Uma2 family endonuclease